MKTVTTSESTGLKSNDVDLMSPSEFDRMVKDVNIQLKEISDRKKIDYEKLRVVIKL